MVRKCIFKSMAVITGLLLQFNLWAQVQPVKLHVETAGTLPTLIAANMKNEITDLTLTGNLNGTDIKFIREMAGSDVNGTATNGKLAVLNLAEVNIVSGGDYYSDRNDSTANNSISDRMFSYCNKLTSLTIPNNVSLIGVGAFFGCTSLTNIIIPNSVTSIGGAAFQNCTGLTSATIGNSVTSIGEWAFWNCTGLTSVAIGNSVTSIGERAFLNCTGLTSLTIPNSVTSIGEWAFQNCTGLTSVTIGNGVTLIGSAFLGCTGITSVIIGNGVTSIWQFTFSDCTNLTSVTIGNNFISVEIFLGFDLKEFNVSEQNQHYSSTDGVLFNKDKTSIIHFPRGKSGTYTIPHSVTSIVQRAFQNCTGLTSLTIPNSVTSIGQWAFYGCTGLTSVTIGNSVTSIGEWAFYGCTGLTSLTIPNSVTSIGQSAFYGCTGLTEIFSKNPTPPLLYGSSSTGFSFYNVSRECVLYVPNGSYNDYRYTEWRYFSNIIEEDYTGIIPIEKDKNMVLSIPNGIAIKTNEQTLVSVYNFSGKQVYQSVISGNTEIPLNKGIYVVVVNNKSEKVIVR